MTEVEEKKDGVGLRIEEAETVAIWSSMLEAEPKGRKEIRCHSGIIKAIRKQLIGEDSGILKGGDLLLKKKSHLEYLHKVLNEKIKEGVSGKLSEGFEMILENETIGLDE